MSSKLKILVADRIAEKGLARLREAEGVEVDVRIGLDVEALAAAVGDYDGMIIRSGAKAPKEVLERAGRLRVIARAGVGVDNVDLEAATASRGDQRGFYTKRHYRTRIGCVGSCRYTDRLISRVLLDELRNIRP